MLIALNTGGCARHLKTILLYYAYLENETPPAAHHMDYNGFDNLQSVGRPTIFPIGRSRNLKQITCVRQIAKSDPRLQRDLRQPSTVHINMTAMQARSVKEYATKRRRPPTTFTTFRFSGMG